MKEEVFYGKGMGRVKEEDEELYQAIVALNDAVWNGKALDYKTQKLIAIGIAASNADSTVITTGFSRMLSVPERYNGIPHLLKISSSVLRYAEISEHTTLMSRKRHPLYTSS